MSNRPFLVIKAHIDSSILEEFETWYRNEHLGNMLKIPGVVGAYKLNAAGRDNGYWFTVLKFENEAALQEALNSTEASRARQAWQRWMPYISEMSVEVYASLSSLLTYHHRN